MLAATVTVLGLTGSAAPASGALRPDAGGLRVASLGDSGSSGEGAGSYFGGSCHRSPHAWPFQLARQTPHHKVRKLGRSALLACSGAGNLSSQLGPLKRLRPKPTLVTITMGWDALGIDGLLENCFFGNCVRDGKLASVRRQTGSRLTNLAFGFLKVRSAVPSATVLLVGYPQFIATSARCTGLRGFNRSERRGLDSLIRQLDADIKAVAAKTGLRYVAVTGALSGHELCSGRHSWVSAVGFGKKSNQQAGHPKTAGQTAIARSVGRYISSHRL
ncbi:MAG TPA: GDSL-type esterase/lipase family protein [Streptosporangiaceae bacterium]|nr:GDSL-type esterase/lipase family protein [Streptosporangiaceae bacterium]